MKRDAFAGVITRKPPIFAASKLAAAHVTRRFWNQNFGGRSKLYRCLSPKLLLRLGCRHPESQLVLDLIQLATHFLWSTHFSCLKEKKKKPMQFQWSVCQGFHGCLMVSTPVLQFCARLRLRFAEGEQICSLDTSKLEKEKRDKAVMFCDFENSINQATQRRWYSSAGGFI